MKPLPQTSYTVLGLLAQGQAMSGYDIRKAAADLQFFYWQPAQSQIYSELTRLAARGYVTAEEIEQEGRPDKRVHQITAAGQAEMSRWLAEDRSDTPVIKHPAALKLYFGGMASTEIVRSNLERFISDSEAALGQLAVAQEFLENEPGQTYAALVADWRYEVLEAELKAARKTLKRLNATDP
jgi:DNA-binding PadR family transcriptional regulator